MRVSWARAEGRRRDAEGERGEGARRAEHLGIRVERRGVWRGAAAVEAAQTEVCGADDEGRVGRCAKEVADGERGRGEPVPVGREGGGRRRGRGG